MPMVVSIAAITASRKRGRDDADDDPAAEHDGRYGNAEAQPAVLRGLVRMSPKEKIFTVGRV